MDLRQDQLKLFSRVLQELQDDPAALAQELRGWADQHGPEILYLGGEWLLAHNRAHAALDYLAQAAQAMPGDVRTVHNHAEALRQCGQTEAAALEFQRAIDLQFDFIPARQALTALLEETLLHMRAAGQQAMAEQQAQALSRLLNDTAALLDESGQGVIALELFKRALTHNPRSDPALSNLGNMMLSVGHQAEAEQYCRQALAINPQLASAWNNLGNVLADRGQVKEAAACYDQAGDLDVSLKTMAEFNKVSGNLFALLHSDHHSDEEVFQRHLDWGRSINLDLPPMQGKLTWQPGEPIRVAYLSADFRSHAMRHYLEPILAGHDPSKVEVVCYMQSKVVDEYTQRLKNYGHEWVTIYGLDDDALVERIRRDRIHILVDCLGHTQNSRLMAMAHKPAPVQMSYLGYLGSTGLPAMDYRITDDWLDPPGLTEGQHTETLLRLPGGSVAYCPHLHTPDVNGLPAQQKGYVTFGSLNKIKKLNLRVVQLWAKILHSVPGSKLLLKTKHFCDPQSVGRILGLFEAHGIATDRLDLRPASHGHLQTYHEIDIALDPFPFGGGATTCDALWMGVPVITSPGTRSASRLTHCLLHTIGRPEWSMENTEEYLNKAVELAADLPALAAIRHSLREQMQTSDLMDYKGFGRRLEAVYEHVLRESLRSVLP